jgi:lysophospholipase L1-like esterase
LQSLGTGLANACTGIANQSLPPAKVLSTNVALLACSGATSTGTSASPNEEDLPAQIAQLASLQTPGPPTSIVTVTIGGDDGKDQGVGFFHVLSQCVSISRPLEPCAEVFLQERKWLLDKEPKILRQDFANIRAAAPSAKIFAVGYPIFFTLQKRCLTIAPEDQAFLNLLTYELDADIQAAAASVQGVTYINITNAFKGHELCSASPDIVAPLTTISVHDWFHPNVSGQAQIASLVAAAIVAGQ